MKPRSLVRKSLGLGTLEDLTRDQRRTLWPPAQALEEQHLRNCKVLANRYDLIKLMPQNGIVAEVGIYHCEFSEFIMERAAPKELHLIDIDPHSIEMAAHIVPRSIRHLGDSSTVISTFPESFFDWIYIDGDHSIEGARKDLEASRTRVKQFIVLNDYTFLDPSGLTKYGVMEATNEFCIKYDWKVVYLALHGRGYYDVAIAP